MAGDDRPYLEETALRAAFDQARARFRGIDVSFETYAGHVTARSDGTPLSGMCTDDLYLACACAAGSESALVAFENELGGDIARALHRVDAHHMQAEDLRQALRERLFVGAGDEAPKIAEYSGRGSLRKWVRVTVLRMRIDAERRRQARPDIPGDSGRSLDIPALEDDPELALMKLRCRDALREVLPLAFRSLTPKERNLLRQRLEHGLKTGEIATLYQVHRATLKRWLAAARERLLAETRRLMAERIGVSGDEFESVMRLVQSNLDMSVRRMLDATGSDT